MLEIETPLPYWVSAWDKPARYKIAYGGRGSGKSWSIATLLLIRAYQRRTRILCAREYQASIADSVHKLLVDQIDRLKLPGFNIGKTEITHVNGSQFIFRGLARNPHSIKSMEGIDIVWIEEAHAVSEDSWTQLIPTIRSESSEIWVSFNPRYLNDPTCKRFYGDNAPPKYRNPENISQFWDGKGTAPEWFSKEMAADYLYCVAIEVNYNKNPWFPEVLRAEMETDYSRDSDRANHVWGGKPLTSSAAQVLFGKWIVKDFTPSADWDGPYYGIDWGVTDPTAAVKCWLYQDCLYIEHEVYGRGVDNIPALLERLPGLKQHASRADNAWPETIRSVQRAGFSRMVACEKWPGSVNDGIAWLRARKQIVIHPSCANAIREAGLWRYKTDNGDNILPALQSGDDHIWDAVRYALQQHIRKRAGGIQNA